MKRIIQILILLFLVVTVGLLIATIYVSQQEGLNFTEQIEVIKESRKELHVEEKIIEDFTYFKTYDRNIYVGGKFNDYVVLDDKEEMEVSNDTEDLLYYKQNNIEIIPYKLLFYTDGNINYIVYNNSSVYVNYKDIEVIAIGTESSDFRTFKDIHVGDSLELVKELISDFGGTIKTNNNKLVLIDKDSNFIYMKFVEDSVVSLWIGNSKYNNEIIELFLN